MYVCVCINLPAKFCPEIFTVNYMLYVINEYFYVIKQGSKLR